MTLAVLSKFTYRTELKQLQLSFQTCWAKYEQLFISMGW